MRSSAGDIARRTRGGSGTSCRATIARQTQSNTSTIRVSAPKIRGRTIAASASVMTASGARVQEYAPPNAKSVQAIAATSTAAPGARSDRFRVVVLVLVAVVARIVVLVAREIDLVEHDGGHLRMRCHDRLE